MAGETKDLTVKDVLESPVPLKAAKTPVSLTDEQKLLIMQEWEKRPDAPPSINELLAIIFPGVNDARSLDGRAIKEFLTSKQLEPPKTYIYQPKGLLPLTVEQKEFIGAQAPLMTPLEIARALYNKPNLSNLAQETRTVYGFIKTLNPHVTKIREEPDANCYKEYAPPKSDAGMILRINKYVTNPIDSEKMTGLQRKQVKALIGYINTYRFMSTINAFTRVTDRELFESGFIRCAYDKEDLTEEEVDQYIVYAKEVVVEKAISERIEQLQEKITESLEENNTIPMAMVEAINSLRNEYNQCIKRQRDLISDLQGKRSERINARRGDNASILHLVEMFREEESRKQLLRLADLRKQAVRDEIDRLASMEAIKARVFGVNVEEFLN